MDSEAFGDLVDTPRGSDVRHSTRSLAKLAVENKDDKHVDLLKQLRVDVLDELSSIRTEMEEQRKSCAAVASEVKELQSPLSSLDHKLDELMALSRSIHADVQQYIKSLNETDSEPGPLVAALKSNADKAEIENEIRRLRDRVVGVEKKNNAIANLIENVNKIFYFLYSKEKGRTMRIKGGLTPEGSLHVSLRKVEDCPSEPVEENEIPKFDDDPAKDVDDDDKSQLAAQPTDDAPDADVQNKNNDVFLASNVTV